MLPAIFFRHSLPLNIFDSFHASGITAATLPLFATIQESCFWAVPEALKDAENKGGALKKETNLLSFQKQNKVPV